MKNSVGKYHVCKWSNRCNTWAISSTCFNNKDDAKNYISKHYGRTTEFSVKFVINGKIV